MEESIFELIRQQQRNDPNCAVDYDAFPKPSDTNALRYAPGALDALSGRFNEKPEGWKDVKALIVRLKSGRLSTAQLESSLKGVRVAPNVDELLAHLSSDDLPECVTRASWNIAKQSRDYEAVKWGIAVGALRLQDKTVPELLTFARHTEFTAYAVVALLRASNERPELRMYLPPLLAVSRGWGIVRLIDFIVRDESLTGNLDLIRAITIYGVENSDGLLIEVGHIIARQLKADAFELARSDSRLFVAIVMLMDEILQTDHPLGGILDVPEPQNLSNEFIRLLASRKPDIWVIWGMRAARAFFDDPECPFEDCIRRSASIALMLHERMSAEIIRAGLMAETTRWIALRIIEQENVVELMPDLERMAMEKPKADVLEVLAQRGDKRQMQLLLDLLPKVVDIDARASRPFSSTNVIWPDNDEAESEYAAIVSVMGQVASQDSIRKLKTAMVDFNPFVRSAACVSASKIPRDEPDQELIALLRKRLQDPLPYVRESAELALKTLDAPKAP